MISLTVPDSSFVPIDQIKAAARGVNRWLYFKVPEPFELRDGNGRKTGQWVREFYGIRSDARMYRAWILESPISHHIGYEEHVLRHLKHFLDQYLDCVAVTPRVAFDRLGKVWHDAGDFCE